MPNPAKDQGNGESGKSSGLSAVGCPLGKLCVDSCHSAQDLARWPASIGPSYREAVLDLPRDLLVGQRESGATARH